MLVNLSPSELVAVVAALDAVTSAIEVGQGILSEQSLMREAAKTSGEEFVTLKTALDKLRHASQQT